MRKSDPAVRTAQHWLLERLSTEPRLMKELVAEAGQDGVAEKYLKKASRRLPVLRRPRELRGPWVWRFPDDDEQVLVQYRCPLQDCPPFREGWMPFGRSRALFRAGLVTYQIRGRLRRSRPAETEGHLLKTK